MTDVARIDPHGETAPRRPRFANILLAGPCNLRCPTCIGADAAYPANLHRFPLAGFDRFVETLRRRAIREVSLTGIDTEPLLYRPLGELVGALRAQVPGVRLSLHTNGLLVLRRQALVERFDRATLSVPSLEPRTCRAMTGRARPVPLARILERVALPLKISVLVTSRNAAEVPRTVARLRELGVRRAVLRRCVGDEQPWPALEGQRLVRRFGSNPVYDVHGLEVTLWDFARTRLDCVNLYSDGSLDGAYRLTAAAREES